MDWSPQQSDALRKVQAWLSNPHRPQVFRLFGTAGTGKTTLAREIAGMVSGKVLFAAFTGKAASVLRKKGCGETSTLHSLAYIPQEDLITGQPKFILNQDSQIRTADLLIVDEVSMCDETLGSDILSFGKPILVLGDPGQLPPIEGQGFFVNAKPDVLLTEVHRQAADNPIIWLANRARIGVKLQIGKYGESSVIPRSALTQRMVVGSDQVIVGRNSTRRECNTKIRTILGHQSDIPVPGETLICLKNDRLRGLLNGGMWAPRIVTDKTTRVDMSVSSLDGAGTAVIDVSVARQFFLGTENELTVWDRKQSDEFTFGYAITCHKSQGSEWPSVMLIDESAVFREDQSRWLYTAITRAAERITIVTPSLR